MANVFMLEQAKIDTAVRHPNPTEYMGKVRIIRGTFTTAATSTAIGNGPIANGDFVIVGFLPKDLEVLNFGLLTFGAMGASTTATVGTYTRSGNTFTASAATRYLGSTSVVSAGSAALANTDTLNFLDTQTADVYLVITAGGANYANGQTLKILLPVVGD